MQITFLGTGTSQGIPLIACPCDVCKSPDQKDKRLRSSILINTGENTFVIDTGPDFRQQMLRESVEKLDAVIFTHEHKDHTAGFDDIRAFNFIMKKKMDVYGNANVHSAIRREFAYIFSDFKYPGIPEIELHLIENKPFHINGTYIIPILASHYKLPVFGFRIGDFTYLTDVNYIDDQEKEKIKGSRVFVISALRRQSHVSHFNLEEAMQLISELGVEKSYITHISHQMGLHSQTMNELPENIQLAYDGLKIEI